MAFVGIIELLAREIEASTKVILDWLRLVVLSAEDAGLVSFLVDVETPLADLWKPEPLEPPEVPGVCETEVMLEELFKLSEVMALVFREGDVESVDREVEVSKGDVGSIDREVELSEGEVCGTGDGVCDKAELGGLIEDVEAVFEELNLSS